MAFKLRCFQIKYLLVNLLKRFYHTKLGQLLWRLTVKIINHPFVEPVLRRGLLSLPSCSPISLDEPPDKHALIVTPFLGSNGAVKYIESLAVSLNRMGYKNHILIYNNEEFPPGCNFCDYYYRIKTSNNNFGFWHINGRDLDDVNGNLVDDWVSSDLTAAITILNEIFHFSICVCSYIFLSRAFTVLPKTTFKILATNDRFTNRNSDILKTGISNSLYFSVKSPEEAIALNRADVVLATQEDDSIFFKTLTNKKVVVQPYVPPANFLPLGTPHNPLKVGFIASSYEPNAYSITSFIEFIDDSIELFILGGVCNKLKNINKKNIKLMGEVSDIVDFYLDCDLYINPDTFFSGSKTKTIEALSFAKPLICTKIAGIGIGSELPYHNARDAKDCAKMVKECVNNPELLVSLHNESKRLFMAFSEKYSPFNCLSSLLPD
jgi:glycosyltransferase involved in cell wall biosynthesis